MPVTQADIDALTSAIASGERQVTIGSQSVTYRSVDDLIKARDDLVRQLTAQNIASGAEQPRARQLRLFHAGRGYD